MTNEHIGICIYEKGRFELRETDDAIIDLKGDFPPIMIASNTVDDGSEPNCADTRSVLHLLNELNEEKEDWKNNCLTSVGENSILWKEISILREQGAEPSDAFKNYLNDLKSKNNKLQGDI